VKLKKFLLGLTCGIVLTATTAVYASNTINAILFPAKYIFNGQEKKLDSEYVTLNMNSESTVFENWEKLVISMFIRHKKLLIFSQ